MTPLFLLLPTLAAAHFKLQAPVAVGPFNEDTEPKAPCGGVKPDAAGVNTSDFHVGGDSISLFLGHPAGNWLFRATTDQTGSSGWTQISPIVAQTGTGDYCQHLVASSSLAGKKGVVGVALNGPDGILYQCAAVNFVAGPASTVSSACKNSTGVTAVFATDPKLTPLVEAHSNGTSSAGTSTGASNSSTGNSGSSSGSSAASVAASPNVPSTVLTGSLIIALVASFVGAGF